MNKRCLFAILIGGYVATGAFAQHTKGSKLQTEIELNEVVVTGSGTQHKLKDSPVPIEVISKLDLQNANVQSMEDALMKLAPSVSFQNNSMGNTLYMNGLPDKYVLILINGRKVAGDISGSVDFGRINIAAVKRIEIVKGASSALYGSDAIAGVINIITDQPEDQLNLMSNTRIGSHGRISETVNASVRAGRFGSTTSYQRQQADGWQLNPYEEGDEGELLETTKQASSKFFSNSVQQDFTYEATDKLSLGIYGSFFNNANDRPTEAYNYNNVHRSYTFGANGKYQILPTGYIEADVNTTNFRSYYDYTKKASGYQPGDLVKSKEQDYTDVNVRGVFNIGTKQILTAGFNYTQDGLLAGGSSTLTDNKDKSVFTNALFAEDEIRLTDAFRVIAGFRYIQHETAGNKFTPKLSAIYQWRGLNVRASYASAFRSPTLQQLYAISNARGSITVGNKNLKPEESDFYNLNAEYNHSIFSVSASAYWNNLRNKIEITNVALLPDDKANGIKRRGEYNNVDKALVKGFDLSFSVRPGAGFSLGANYNYTDAKNTITEKPLERSVMHSGSANANWQHSWKWYTLAVNVNGRYQGTRWSETYDSSPAFQLWDLGTRHTFHLKAFTLEPGIGVENIFNYTDSRPWNSHYATVTPGRSVYASLLIRFKQ